MARTLILNISAEAQTLPAAYGSYAVSVGHGRVVSDESSLVVAAMGGFETMHGKWAVSAISTDEALGDVDVAAGGVALLASFISGGNGGGGPTYWADILNKPSFANVATSGAYSDLTGKPALADVATSGLYDDLSGTPTLPSASNAAPAGVSTTGAAGVLSTYARGDHQHAHGNLSGGTLHSTASTSAAGFMSAADKSKLDGLENFSGAYADLSGAPALAAVATSGAYADLSGKPSLAAVATSGAYTDLSGKPSLFSGSYNDLSDKPTIPTVPTLAAVATSGAYSDLTGKPSLFSGDYADLTSKPSLFSGAYADLSGKPSLATVATSGAYSDLSGKPSLAAIATSGSASDLANNPYDIIANATGALTVGQSVLKAFAPRALVLSALTQASTTTAAVQIKIDGVAASYPQAVSAGALIEAVVTVAGTDCWFTITGKVA